MIISCMVGMSVTAGAIEAKQSDENDYMRYNVGFIGFNVHGKVDGSYIQTTFSNSGFITEMMVGSEYKEFSSFAYGKEYTLGGVTAYVTASLSSHQVDINYVLKNNGTEAATVKIGSSGDVQIGDNDQAPITFADGVLTMTDGTNTFKLKPGSGNFTTKWFGNYNAWETGSSSSSTFMNTTQTSLTDTDSAIGWSWTIEIPAGQTVTKNAVLVAGDSQTIDDDTKYTVTYTVGDHAEGDDLVIPDNEAAYSTLTSYPADWQVEDGYLFYCWTDGTNNYGLGAGITLTGDLTLEAVWVAYPAYAISPEGAGSVAVDVSTAEGCSFTYTATAAEGYSFKNWEIRTEGGQSQEVTNNPYDLPTTLVGSVTLTAVFEEDQADTYTVTYNGNGATSGDVPTDPNEYVSGASVTVLGNTGNLAKTDAEFLGWSKSQTATAAEYVAGSKFAIGEANVTLYAVWKQTSSGSGKGLDGGTSLPVSTPSSTSTSGTTPTKPTTTTTPTTPAATDNKTENGISFEGETTLSNSDLLSWSGINDAKSYTLSVEIDGKFVALTTTTNSNVDVIHGADGNYYVSEGGKYTKYVYEDGKFVKEGTISVNKANKLTKANDVADNFLLQYTDKNGKLSSAENSLTTSVYVYYKPAVEAAVKDNKASLTWKVVEGATKYAVYSVRSDGTLKLLKVTKNAHINIAGLKQDKTYRFVVRALVNGKLTTANKSDIVKVKI